MGAYRVVSRPLTERSPTQQAPSEPLGFVQYAKPESSLDRTIARVQLFLGLGVLAGTALALLAGLAVARRAMAPIAGLTSAAQRITRTRDPATALPRTEADDEVSDLARTLEEMLASLDASRAETESALARQREFVADASHELRTPLTSVLANLELLETELQGEQSEIAESALRSSKRMRRSGRRPAAARPRRRRPPRSAATVRSDRRRRRGARGASPARGRPRDRARHRRRRPRVADGRGRAGRPPPPRSQPRRERDPPHARGDPRTGPPAPGRGRRRARGER